MIGEKAAVISLAVGGSVLFYAGVFVWLTSEFSTRNLLMLLAGAAMLALAVVLFLRSGNKKSGKSSTDADSPEALEAQISARRAELDELEKKLEEIRTDKKI